MLALLGDGGRVLGAQVALHGLQRVAVALQVHVVRDQGQEVRGRHFLAASRRFWIEIPAVLFRGGHVRDLDVGDADLLQGPVRMSQLHLLHVVDGYRSVNGLLGTDAQDGKSGDAHACSHLCLRAIFAAGQSKAPCSTLRQP